MNQQWHKHHVRPSGAPWWCAWRLIMSTAESSWCLKSSMFPVQGNVQEAAPWGWFCSP